MQIFNAENGEGNPEQIVGDPMAFVQMGDADSGAEEKCDGKMGVPFREEEIILKKFRKKSTK